MPKKKLLLITLLSLTILLFWCWTKKTVDTTVVATWKDLQETFVVGKEAFLQDNVYGSVIADNINTILSSVGWSVDVINCQPWNTVKKWDLIAQIIPVQEDVTFKNSLLLEKSLKGQLTRLFDSYKSTSQNFEIQADTLKKQKENNIKQLEILNQNLENFMKQKLLSSWDINIQTQTLEAQLKALQIDKEKNVWRALSNLENVKKQNLNTLADAFKKIDEIFGITDANKTKNDAFEIYLSAKNTSLKTQVENEFYRLYTIFSTINTKSDPEISQYLFDVTNLLKIASDAVNNSISSSTFPQVSTSPTIPSIDWFYATFNGLSNSLLASKTSFDNVYLSYDSLVNNYDNQINTMTLTLQNLKSNKTDMTNINLDTQINNSISQINNLELAIKTANDQINSAVNSKVIQLNTLSSQSFNLQQNYDTVKNNINWEKLYAGVDWIIKSKYITQWNKIWPNILVCQISPSRINNLKIQLFSSIEMELLSDLEFYNKDKLLWIAKLQYELPFKDNVTQNYIYEITNFDFQVREWDRLTIKFDKALNIDELRIPLEYVMPRLDWDYVKLKKWTKNIEIKITLWDIDGWFVKIVDGLIKGNVIVK